MSVTTLAIQPPVQLSAVTRVSRASRRRSPVVPASACSSASFGGCLSDAAMVPVYGTTGRPAGPPASVADPQGGAVHPRRTRERVEGIERVVGLRRNVLERTVEADLHVVGIGEVGGPQLERPAAVGRAQAYPRVEHRVGVLVLLHVEVGAGVVAGHVL